MSDSERDLSILRHIVAHRYGTVDHTITWDVVVHDIPILKEYCQKEIDQ